MDQFLNKWDRIKTYNTNFKILPQQHKWLFRDTFSICRGAHVYSKDRIHSRTDKYTAWLPVVRPLIISFPREAGNHFTDGLC